MASKLLNFVALSTLAVLAISFGATPADALSAPHGHVNRHVDHAPIARKKRDTTRCKTRSSSVVASSTAQPTSTSTTHSSAKTTSSSKAAAKTTSAKATTTTSSASSASAASGSGAFGTKGHKICLAWGMGNDEDVLKKFKTSHVTGIYDWGVDKPEGSDSLGLDFWPMLWGGDDSRISAFESAMQTKGLGTIILGFNEPNEEGQSNMDPTWAASLWQQHIQPYCDAGYKCATPAMSSRPNGFEWMSTFMSACTQCTFDYQAVHWYDIGFDTLQTYLEKYYAQVQLPIILTEFADQNFNGGAQATSSEVWSFMSQALAYIDDTDWMAGACPFGVMTDLQGVNELNALLGSDDNPTDLGYFVIANGNN